MRTNDNNNNQQQQQHPTEKTNKRFAYDFIFRIQLFHTHTHIILAKTTLTETISEKDKREIFFQK